MSEAFCTGRSLLCFLPKAAFEGKGVGAVHLARLLRCGTAEVWALRLTISAWCRDLPPTSHLLRSAGARADARWRHWVKSEPLMKPVGHRSQRSDQWLKSRCEIAFQIGVSSQHKSCFGGMAV